TVSCATDSGRPRFMIFLMSVPLNLNLLRSFVFNTVITVALPLIFHADLVWYTYVIYEALVFLTGWLITKHSERNGIQFI
ncbi:MAG: hypothetical protein IJP37_00455, partial [Clostridia bacterium]|nr:hypothetical protein [Clostridia bacterium]